MGPVERGPLCTMSLKLAGPAESGPVRKLGKERQFAVAWFNAGETHGRANLEAVGAFVSRVRRLTTLRRRNDATSVFAVEWLRRNAGPKREAGPASRYVPDPSPVYRYDLVDPSQRTLRPENTAQLIAFLAFGVASTRRPQRPPSKLGQLLAAVGPTLLMPPGRPGHGPQWQTAAGHFDVDWGKSDWPEEKHQAIQRYVQTGQYDES